MRKASFLLSTLLITLSLILLVSVPAFAAKPAGNLASAQTVAWNLSADVMPVPPYGSLDIPGSDVASKLIVNQPNGNTEVTLTGVMNGLTPNTTYTVYVSKGYTPFVSASIDMNFVADFYVNNNWASAYDINLATGTAGYPAGSASYSYNWDSITYSFSGNTFNLTSVYSASNADVASRGCITHMTGTIAADGSISGEWDDNYPSQTGSRTGTWTAPAGTATQYSGSTGWSGLFSSSIQPFTFTTDEFGSGSWHLNLRDENFPTGGPTFDMSVWINGAGGTILISDTFQVVKG